MLKTTAKWITLPDVARAGNQFFYARRRWLLESVPTTVELRISADCRYRLWLNGICLGGGPARGSSQLMFYDCYQVAKYLHVGCNECFVEVNCIGEQNFTVDAVRPALLVDLPGMLVTGSSWQVQRATSWHTDVPHYTRQSGFMEFCDFRQEPDDAKWSAAWECRFDELPCKRLLPNSLPPQDERRIYPVECLKTYAVQAPFPERAMDIPDHLGEEPHLPLSPDVLEHPEALLMAEGNCLIHPSGDGMGVGLILDFGQEISGRAELIVKAPAGTSVQMVYGEALSGDRIATRFADDYHFTDCFILKAGENTVTTAFAERGFRMLQVSIRNFDEVVEIRRVSGVDRRYPFSRRGSFFSSDYRLNRIYDVCAETLNACSSDVFMDCPWRERAFWVNDLLVNNLATLHCFGPTELHRHCLALAFSQPHSSGLLPAVVPQPKMKGEPAFVFAATNLYMALVIKDYWLFSRDFETVQSYLPDLQRILNILWGFADEDGMLFSSGITAEWNFYDWSFEENGYHCSGARESFLSSLYVISAKAFMELAEGVGWDFDKTAMQRRIALLVGNFEKRFCNLATGLLEDEVLTVKGNRPVKLPTQLGHALWLLTGEASEECAQRCRQALSDHSLLMPDYYLHYFWFQASHLAGCESEALERIRHYWGRCIDTGSPTLYEAGIHTFGKSAMGSTGSLCHGFGTIPVAFLHEVVLGIRPMKPGFTEFSFSPNLLGLDFAEGRIPVKTGCIHVRVEPQRCLLRIPIGCQAVLPMGKRLPPGEHVMSPGTLAEERS